MNRDANRAERTSEEAEEIVYNAEIEELEHFDIGEYAETEEVNADELNVWPSGSDPNASILQYQRYSSQQPSTSSNRKRLQVVPILRRGPDRQSRVKSFKDLVGYSESNSLDVRQRRHHTESQQVVNEASDASEEIDASNNASVVRIFSHINQQDPKMFFDWPIYSKVAELMNVAAHIIVTDAAHIHSSMICSSVPQEFTSTGTFVIDGRKIGSAHTVMQDGLGSWGNSQGSSKYYIRTETGKVSMGSVNNYSIKVLCNRYVHPGTDERGRLVKKVYHGVAQTGEPSQYVVVTFEWLGIPHALAVLKSTMSMDLKMHPVGSKTWEEEHPPILDSEEDHVGIAGMYGSVPLFSRSPITFDFACRILLAGFQVKDSCIAKACPQRCRECGTFVIDMEKCGGERSATEDGFDWSRPSGSSRYFRFDPDGNALRVDKNGLQPPAEDYDIQIVCRRYESEKIPDLIKKVFVAREKEGHKANSHLAIITYRWRGEQKPMLVDKDDIKTPRIRVHHGISSQTIGLPIGIKRRTDDISSDEPISNKRSHVDGRATNGVSSLEASPHNNMMTISHADNLKRLALAKQIENQDRMCELLNRAENLLEKFESSGHNLLPLARQMMSVWDETSNHPTVVVQDNVEEDDEETTTIQTEQVVMTRNMQTITIPPGYQLQYADD